jgi:GT2 family glycosyltransferase
MISETSADVREARARAAELEARLTAIRLSAWEMDRRLAQSEFALSRALGHIARTQPLLRIMRGLLVSMQDSKFWQLRQQWFALKKRFGMTEIGPQPYFAPVIDETDERWEAELPYQRWLVGNRLRPTDIARISELTARMRTRPLISVLVPVYDPPEDFLRAMLDSVVGQHYRNWELCIVDDASTQPHVRLIIEEYAAKDDRIRPLYRSENGHIAAASNDALALARGEFVALLDHDDTLAPEALFEVAFALDGDPADIVYSDEDKIDGEGTRSDPYFKPDWAPDSLLARNYVSHLGVYRTSLVREIGGFRAGFEGSQDYDLVLRASERTRRILHIPRVLYHWRVSAHSTAGARDQKGYAQRAAVRALEEALARRGEPGRVVEDAEVPGIYSIRYEVRTPELVSIIIPTRDHAEDLERCLRALFEASTWSHFEVVLLDNGSTEPATARLLAAWQAREPERFRVVRYDVPFNFSTINNHAVTHARGRYLLFLNNDTEAITPDWIGAMVEQAQRPSIGAVGAKLLYADDTVQHAGVVIGLGGVAGHSHKYYPASAPGYFYMLQTVNNYSAVTGACLMVRREVFEQVGGFDAELAIAFNDVDLCLRIAAAGYYNVYLPHVQLYHYESKSRGMEDTPEKMARFLREQRTMQRRWHTADVPDPFYNLNLTLLTEDYAIRA